MVSGACFAIGRQAFEELRGFDERFFMYFEDADLCRRASAAGMPIRYVPDAVVTHIGGASSSEDYHFGPYHARSMRQYLGKWYGPPGSALAIVLLWLRAVGFSVTFRPQAKRAWRALWAALTDEDPRK
jgi:GT2 family glycosyltransferase